MSEVEKLRGFIQQLDGFKLFSSDDGCYDHMGATLVDAIFQAGINYKYVVEPRVERLRTSIPEARTTSGFQAALKEHGISRLLDWAEGKKPETLTTLVSLLAAHGVETEEDLRTWISIPDSENQIRSIKGIGDKTVDYLKILCGLQSVAVDVHLQKFVALAGISPHSYAHVKELIIQTADAMLVPHSSLDYSIWKYMSERPR